MLLACCGCGMGNSLCGLLCMFEMVLKCLRGDRVEGFVFGGRRWRILPSGLVFYVRQSVKKSVCEVSRVSHCEIIEAQWAV